MSEQHGIVEALSAWDGDGRPLREVDEQRALRHKGFVGDARGKGKRGLTLLSAEQWEQTTRDVAKSLPWHTRRANILVSGIDLPATIGRRLRIGEVEIYVWDETRPCALMDELCPGLRAALKPDRRGGVHGQVLNDGTIRAGDPITLLAAAPDQPPGD